MTVELCQIFQLFKHESGLERVASHPAIPVEWWVDKFDWLGQLGRQALKHGNHDNSQQHPNHGQGHAQGGEGKDRHLHNPIEDRLIPLEPLDLGKITSIDGLPSRDS